MASLGNLETCVGLVGSLGGSRWGREGRLLLPGLPLLSTRFPLLLGLTTLAQYCVASAGGLSYFRAETWSLCRVGVAEPVVVTPRPSGSSLLSLPPGLSAGLPQSCPSRPPPQGSCRHLSLHFFLLLC